MPCAEGEGEGVTVAQADVAVPVVDFVVVERDGAPTKGMALDEEAVLVRVGVRVRLEGLDNDDVAVIELFIPKGGADAQVLAGGDVEGCGAFAVLAFAHANGHGLAEGCVGEVMLAHALGEGLALEVGSRECDGGLVGVIEPVARPVVSELVECRSVRRQRCTWPRA